MSSHKNTSIELSYSNKPHTVYKAKVYLLAITYYEINSKISFKDLAKSIRYGRSVNVPYHTLYGWMHRIDNGMPIVSDEVWLKLLKEWYDEIKQRSPNSPVTLHNLINTWKHRNRPKIVKNILSKTMESNLIKELN